MPHARVDSSRLRYRQRRAVVADLSLRLVQPSTALAGYYNKKGIHLGVHRPYRNQAPQHHQGAPYILAKAHQSTSLCSMWSHMRHLRCCAFIWTGGSPGFPFLYASYSALHAE